MLRGGRAGHSVLLLLLLRLLRCHGPRPGAPSHNSGGRRQHLCMLTGGRARRSVLLLLDASKQIGRPELFCVGGV